MVLARHRPARAERNGRVVMTWFKIDDSLWGHPKWLATPPRARALWVTAGSYSAAQLTDGVIYSSVLRLFASRTGDADALVRSGLWERLEGGNGYRFHDWSDYQPTRESVEETRKYERDRKREQRRRTNGTYARRPAGTTNGTPNGSPTNPSRPDPSRPLSSLPPHDTHPPQGTADEETNLSKNAKIAQRLLGCPPDDPRLDAIDALVATHRPNSPRAWLKSVHANGDLDDLLEQATATDADPWAHMPHDTGGDQ